MIALRAVILFLMFLSAPVCAKAQGAATVPDRSVISEAHLQRAYETVLITRASSAYRKVIPNLVRRAKEQLIQKYPHLRAEIIKTVDDVALSLIDRQSELDVRIARSWAERFSEGELREISAFYATPTGSKLAKQNTSLIAAALDSARAWGGEIGAALVTGVQERLTAQGHQLQ